MSALHRLHFPRRQKRYQRRLLLYNTQGRKLNMPPPPASQPHTGVGLMGKGCKIASTLPSRPPAPLPPPVATMCVCTLRPSPFHAMVGTPADCAMIVEPILSPKARMGGPEGLFTLSRQGQPAPIDGQQHTAHDQRKQRKQWGWAVHWLEATHGMIRNELTAADMLARAQRRAAAQPSQPFVN